MSSDLATMLYGGVEYNQPIENEAVDETWKFVPLPSLLGKNIVSRGLEYVPYLNDIWQGRDLLFHKPFGWMSEDEYTNYGKIGKKYYKQYLHNNVAKHKDIGDISFPNSQAGKPDYRYMQDYPLLRYKINKNDNYFYKLPDKFRQDANGFYNLDMGNLIYQLRDNKYNESIDFYNIKPKK